jgi:hypothetical protein
MAKRQNINTQQQAGEVTDVRLIPGGNFVYDLKFTTGFGPRAQKDIKECDVIKIVEEKKRIC